VPVALNKMSGIYTNMNKLILRYYKLLIAGSMFFAPDPGAAQTVKSSLIVSENAAANAFPLFSSTTTPAFYYDTSDAKVVQIAAEAFINDVKQISGKQIKSDISGIIYSEYAIIAGTIGQSKVIDELIVKKLISVTTIQSKWENFTIQQIKGNPLVKGSKSSAGWRMGGLLVIAGSDRRGTAFGIFHLSRLMGVSPFVWWADVAPARRKQLYVTGSYTSATPSVQYRGIFINDEDWGMQPWAAKNIDTDVKDIGPKT